MRKIIFVWRICWKCSYFAWSLESEAKMVNYLEIVSTLCVSIILVIFHSHKMLNFTAKAKENYFYQCSIRISLFAILFIIKFNNTEIFVIIKGTLIIIELSKILDIPLNEHNFFTFRLYLSYLYHITKLI